MVLNRYYRTILLLLKLLYKDICMNKNPVFCDLFENYNILDDFFRFLPFFPSPSAFSNSRRERGGGGYLLPRNLDANEYAFGLYLRAPGLCWYLPQAPWWSWSRWRWSGGPDPPRRSCLWTHLTQGLPTCAPKYDNFNTVPWPIVKIKWFLDVERPSNYPEYLFLFWPFLSILKWARSLYTTLSDP